MSLRYEKIDETNVKLVNIADLSSTTAQPEKFRIPPAGSTNADVELWIATFGFQLESDDGDGDSDGENDNEGSCKVHHLRLPVPLRVIYPWCEYPLLCVLCVHCSFGKICLITTFNARLHESGEMHRD